MSYLAFLYTSQTNLSSVACIQKLYLRLIPEVLILFTISVPFNQISFEYIFGIITLTSGLSIPGELIPAGLWFVAVNFWCSVFLYLY